MKNFNFDFCADEDMVIVLPKRNCPVSNEFSYEAEIIISPCVKHVSIMSRKDYEILRSWYSMKIEANYINGERRKCANYHINEFSRSNRVWNYGDKIAFMLYERDLQIQRIATEAVLQDIKSSVICKFLERKLQNDEERIIFVEAYRKALLEHNQSLKEFIK